MAEAKGFITLLRQSRHPFLDFLFVSYPGLMAEELHKPCDILVSTDLCLAIRSLEPSVMQ